MLKFFHKKKPSYPEFSWLKKDIHSHLLPGIDDGSPDIETSIELLRQLSSSGIKEFICTPHIIGDMYRNNSETISNALAKLQYAIRQEGLDVKISAAAEYMLDDYFMQIIQSGERLLTLNDRLLLTELPFTIQPNNLEEIAFAINTNGYHPIMAHPERYGYFFRNRDGYYRLKELGFFLQINLLSLTGYYGSKVLKAAQFLLSNNLVDFVGTDLHHFNHLHSLIDERSVRIFEKYLGDKIYNNF